jgi:hypothetical protein
MPELRVADEVEGRSNLLARAAVQSSRRLATQASRACLSKSGCLKQTFSARKCKVSSYHALLTLPIAHAVSNTDDTFKIKSMCRLINY